MSYPKRSMVMIKLLIRKKKKNQYNSKLFKDLMIIKRYN